MENETYKTLYLHAFNRMTDLIQEIQRMQAELEEMYLAAGDSPEHGTAEQ